MVEIDEALVEKAARAICCPDGKCASETKPHGWLVPQPCNAVIYRAEARAVIPLIEAQAFERAEEACHVVVDRLLAEAAECRKSPERRRAAMLREDAASGARVAATAIRSLTQGDSQQPKDDV